MKKLAMCVLLAGAMGAIAQTHAEDAPADAGFVAVPADEGLPVDGGGRDLVDPVPVEGELKPEPVEAPVVDADDEVIYTIGGEDDASAPDVKTDGDDVPVDVPVDDKVVGPPPGEMQEDWMYITGAPVEGEATAGPGGDLSRAGVDEATPAADALPAGFPAPMDVMDNAGSTPRATKH